MNQKQITLIKKQYYKPEVLSRLIKEMCFKNGSSTFYRELAVLNANRIAFRGITFSTAQYLQKTLFNETFSNLNFYGNDANLYVSVARVKRFPNFSYKLSQRSKETKSFFRNEYQDYIYWYDLFLDFDIDVLQEKKFENETEKRKYMEKNMIPFITEIEKVIGIIEKYKLRAEIVFSGSRGFKVLFWNNLLQYEQLVSVVSELPKALDLKYVDTAGSFVKSKLMKLNFSLAFKNNKCNLVFPLRIYNYKKHFQFMKHFKSFECFDYKYQKDMIVPAFLNIYGSQFLQKDNGKKGLETFLKDYELI